MSPGELYLFINDKKWELEWCRGDFFETQDILREIEYAIGATECYIMNNL